MKRIKSTGFYQGQTEEQGSQAAAHGANLKGHYDVTGIIRNMVLANLGFHTQMNFSQNYPQFGHVLSRGFTNPVLI
jgi:formylmethanofuran dehydrogenase subunit B